MSKKTFKNPALNFINTQEVAHDVAQETPVQKNVLPPFPEVEPREGVGFPPMPSPAPEPAPRNDYIRTQGRKGHKKPRINLAFDSDTFLDEIRKRAERDGMSITQLVNDAVAFYLKKTK